MNKFNNSVVVSILLFMVLSCNYTNTPKKKQPEAKEGIMDLRNWDFESDGPVLLKGEWEFYWKKLIDPSEFNIKSISEDGYYPVPDKWNKMTINNKKLNGKGFATFKLKIISNKNQKLEICINELMTAYKCWCNQNEIVAIGKVSDRENEATPRLLPVIKELDIVKDTTILVFQISNFHHRTGGFFTTPKIGLIEDIFRAKIMKIAFDLFLFGSIFIISLYHFGLSFMRREKLTSLFFGLFTLLMAIRTLLTGSFVISIPFPDISWFLKYRIEYLTLYLSPIFISGFFYNIYREDINRRFILIFIGICIIYAFTTLLPTVIFTELWLSFIIILAISVAYLFTVLIKTVIRKRLDAKILFSSVLILISTTINDILLVNGYVHNTIELVPFGTFIFVLGQSLVLARIFSDAFNKNELLTTELNYQNKNLEKIIQDRTVELVHQKEELQSTLENLKSTQFQLIQSEKMASLGQLTAGIAHEIENPLNFVNNFSEISNELVDELKSEKAKGKSERDEALEDEILNDIKQNLEKINHHGKRADAIVKSMLQHSRSNSGHKEPTDINALADEFLRLSYHGMRAKDKSFNAEYKTEFDPNLPKINVIPQDIGRVLLNLINNAFYAVDKRAKLQTPPRPSVDGGAKNDQNIYRPTVTVSTTSSKSPSGIPA